MVLNKELLSGVSPEFPLQKGTAPGTSSNAGLYAATQIKQTGKLNKNIEEILTQLAAAGLFDCDDVTDCVSTNPGTITAVETLIEAYLNEPIGDGGNTRFCERAQDCVGLILEDYAYDDATNSINLNIGAHFDTTNGVLDIAGDGTALDPFIVTQGTNFNQLGVGAPVIPGTVTGQLYFDSSADPITQYVRDGVEWDKLETISALEVSQVGHGLGLLDWIRFDEVTGDWVLAQADATGNLGHWHVVEVIDANTFKTAKDGVFTIPNALPAGEYVLDQTIAGGYTQIPPAIGISLYGMEVIDANTVSLYTVMATDETPEIILPCKYVEVVTLTANTPVVVNHGLNDLDTMIQTYDTTTGLQIFVTSDIMLADPNNIELTSTVDLTVKLIVSRC